MNGMSLRPDRIDAECRGRVYKFRLRVLANAEAATSSMCAICAAAGLTAARKHAEMRSAKELDDV
jgi:hypothetical protein